MKNQRVFSVSRWAAALAVMGASAACGGGDEAPLIPGIVVEDQTLTPADQVKIVSVTSLVPGFLVLREDTGGTPGVLIGKLSVNAGINQDLTVRLDRAARDQERIHAILHRDGSLAGVFEFDDDPTLDAPVTNDAGDVVKASFTVTVSNEEIVPEVVAAAQVADPANRVVVARVVSKGPGFIVIHEDDAGQPAAVVGHTAVQMGANDDVIVDMNRDARDGETLHAMLHVDDGDLGVYEFDGVSGADDPAMDADGNVVMAPFVVSVAAPGGPVVIVDDQEVQPLDRVVVRRVVSDTAGFIVIREDDGGTFGAPIGSSTVATGTNLDVVVELDREVRNGETLFAVLHTDDGTAGVFEFDGQNGLDAPVADLDGNIVGPSFTVSFEPQVVALDQVVQPVDRLVVDLAIVDGAGWLVIHADAAGPGPVLGQAALRHGTNQDVVVDLSRSVEHGETLYAMLHTDDGVEGVYEFDGVNGLDAPIRNSAGNVVAPPFVVTFAAAVTAQDHFLTASEAVLIDEVTSQGPGFIVVHEALMGGGVGAVLGFTAVPNGTSGSIVVALNRAAVQGETLYAMLHEDTGQIGVYEFSSPGDPDAPALDDAGNVIAPAFTVGFPQVVVADQDTDPTTEVQITAVTLDRPGFVVIHADDAGSPGAVLGNASISGGTSVGVTVILSRSVTRNQRLHAMLHEDSGQLGVYEFDGRNGLDVPVTFDGLVVNEPFVVDFLPGVQASDQTANPLNTVVVDNVRSVGPGWIVIRDSDTISGRGVIIGFAPLVNGTNLSVSVTLDRQVLNQEVLYAMLHTDAGTAGVFEFTTPGDPDAVVIDGNFNPVEDTFIVSR